MAKPSSRFYPQFEDCARNRAFEIVYTNAAKKQLGAIPPDARNGLEKKLNAFSRGEEQLGIEKINADRSLRKLRWGNYRLVFKKPDRDHVITVVKVADRKSAYRDF